MIGISVCGRSVIMSACAMAQIQNTTNERPSINQKHTTIHWRRLQRAQIQNTTNQRPPIYQNNTTIQFTEQRPPINMDTTTTQSTQQRPPINMGDTPIQSRGQWPLISGFSSRLSTANMVSTVSSNGTGIIRIIDIMRRRFVR